MKVLFTLLLTLATHGLWAQQDTAKPTAAAMTHAIYERHSWTPTVSLGFVDGYRNNYSLPAGFYKNNTSGFAPIFLKLEYGLSAYWGIAATMNYDGFTYNFSQQYQGNNGPFIRTRTDAFKLLSGGVTAFYHLHQYIRVRNLDPFVGAGVSLNNIRYSAYPAADSSMSRTDHKVTLYLKAGARYYITDKFSFYADAGYDKTAIITVGASCRFFRKK